MPIQTYAVPSSDRAFTRVVREAARAVDSPEELLGQLRAMYPSIVVSERALSGEPRAYYVYRDGMLFLADSDAWWTAPSTAFADIDARSGQLVGANDTLAELLGSPAEPLIGRHFTELVLPEARATAQTLFESLVELNEVRSGVLVRRADGGTLELEFRAARESDLIRVYCRPRQRLGNAPGR